VESEIGDGDASRRECPQQAAWHAQYAAPFEEE
jgi:hypothetical protein